MDTTISPLLNLTVPFGEQRGLAAEAILDKMKAAHSSVEYLLDHDLQVFIYNGQLDWLVTTMSTSSWVDKLNWHGSSKWPTSKRTAFYVDGIHEGHEKHCDNLEFYWIKRAGHRVSGILIDNRVCQSCISINFTLAT